MKNFCSFWCVHLAVQVGVLQNFVVRLLSGNWQQFLASTGGLWYCRSGKTGRFFIILLSFWLAARKLLPVLVHWTNLQWWGLKPGSGIVVIPKESVDSVDFITLAGWKTKVYYHDGKWQRV